MINSYLVRKLKGIYTGKTSGGSHTGYGGQESDEQVWWNGIHAGLKILWEKSLRVRVSLPALKLERS